MKNQLKNVLSSLPSKLFLRFPPETCSTGCRISSISLHSGGHTFIKHTPGKILVHSTKNSSGSKQPITIRSIPRWQTNTPFEATSPIHWGEAISVPLVGGPWNNFDEIDFAQLPEQFVLKCTHDSGGIVICSGKDSFDMKTAREKIEKSLKRNYYWGGREWPYRDIQPRIIAEAFMADDSGDSLVDYKFYMFGGTAQCVLVCTNRSAKSRMNMTFFTPDWNRLPFERQYKNDPNELEKPEHFEKMLSLAEQLSANLPFARIDLYEINHKVYFGEITLHPASGLGKFEPVEWDYTLGEWLDLEHYFPGKFT
ncbi:MAG: ATP-grasp fold amidoligase family protein [Eubacteriales bacterium]